MPSTVGEVARLAGITVRTLHHYDEIGLLRPSGRSEAGYRRYSASDLQRLQQVLFYRELGFGLSAIGGLLDGPGYDRPVALEMQRDMLERKAQRLRAMIDAVDAALDAEERGTTMDKSDMFEVFGEFDPAIYEAEVEERWGDTEAFAESARRTSRYTKKDWEQIKAESGATVTELIAQLDAGVPAADPAVMRLAEEHRLHIDRYFYPCSRKMHLGLGEMYVTDPRFKKTYDDQREGLAEYLRDAIRANASE